MGTIWINGNMEDLGKSQGNLPSKSLFLSTRSCSYSMIIKWIIYSFHNPLLETDGLCSAIGNVKTEYWPMNNISTSSMNPSLIISIFPPISPSSHSMLPGHIPSIARFPIKAHSFYYHVCLIFTCTCLPFQSRSSFRAGSSSD